jgi:hypothetical protein
MMLIKCMLTIRPVIGKPGIILVAIGLAAGSLPAAPKEKKNTSVRLETTVERLSKPVSPHSAAQSLDTAKVRGLYIDGEFQSAIEILEGSLNTTLQLSHTDSVFIFKHLGVMFAADYEKRERGKMYMFQLLMTEPTAKILDMYASDMIYMIFKNIQDEFEIKKAKFMSQSPDGIRPEPIGKGLQADSNPKLAETSSIGKTLIWVGASGAVLAAGVFAYIALDPGEKTVSTKLHFPE